MHIVRCEVAPEPRAPQSGVIHMETQPRVGRSEKKEAYKIRIQ